MIRRQVKAVFFLRMVSYARNVGHTITTFATPVAFALVALILQLLASSVTSPSLTLSSPRLTQESDPLFYAFQSDSSSSLSPAGKQQQQQALLQLMDSLGGSNHALLMGGREALERRFDSDMGNSQGNGAGSRAVGLVFERMDLAKCSAKYTLVYQPWRVHQIPSVVATINNAFLKAVAANHSLTAVPSSLSVSSFPLHFSSPDFVFAYLVAAVVAIGMIMVPPVLAAQLVSEVEFGHRTMLKVAGMRGFSLWLATMAGDCLAFWLCH